MEGGRVVAGEESRTRVAAPLAQLLEERDERVVRLSLDDQPGHRVTPIRRVDGDHRVEYVLEPRHAGGTIDDHDLGRVLRPHLLHVLRLNAERREDAALQL